MKSEKTLDKERERIRDVEWKKLNRDEAAFLEAALFALDWLKGGIRSRSPIRFIEWRRDNNRPYIYYEREE